MVKKTFAIFLLCFLLSSNLVFAIPEPSGFVNDFEGIIENREELEEKLVNFERETAIEIVVLTTPDFGDTYLEDYAVEVFEQWGIGKEGEDNGVLILVSKEQRKSRVEVGYGLEGFLTDGLTGRIQDSAMIPYFSQGEYSTGINEGVEMIMGVLAGEEYVGVTQEEDDSEGLGCLVLIFLGFLLLIPNPFVGAIIGGFLGLLAGSIVFGPSVGLIGLVVGAILGFILGLIARLIPAPIRYGIASSMISSSRGGGVRSGGFGGFGGGGSGGGGSSRSW